MPENIQKYSRGKLASSAVGVPRQDQSGAIINQGVQSLASAVSDTEVKLKQASDIFAVYQAEDWLHKRNEEVARTKTATLAAHATDPENFQQDYRQKVEELDGLFSGQIPSGIARSKFDQATRASRADIVLSAQDELYQNIKKQNEISGATRIDKAFTSLQPPTNAAEIQSFYNQVTQTREVLSNDASLKYVLQGAAEGLISQTAQATYLAGMEQFIDKNPLEAQLVIQDKDFQATVKEKGFIDADGYTKLQKLADEAVINHDNKVAIDETVNVMRIMQELDLGSQEALYSSLQRANAEMGVMLARGETGDAVKTKQEEIKQLERISSAIGGNKLLKDQFVNRAEFSRGTPSESKDTGATFLTQLNNLKNATFQPDKQTGILKLTNVKGGFKANIDKIASLQREFIAAKAEGRVYGDDATKVEEGFSTIATAAMLFDSVGNTAQGNIAGKASYFDTSRFSKNVLDADSMTSALTSMAFQYAGSKTDADASTRGALVSKMTSESMVALDGILRSIEYQEKVAASVGNKQALLRVQQDVLAEAYAQTFVSVQRRYRKPGAPAIGDVLVSVGRVKYVVTGTRNKQGHLEVERYEPQSNQDDPVTFSKNITKGQIFAFGMHS